MENMESDIKVMQFNLLALAPEMHGWEPHTHWEKNDKNRERRTVGERGKREKQEEEQEVTEVFTEIRSTTCHLHIISSHNKSSS